MSSFRTSTLSQPTALNECWFAVRVRPRHEKSTALQLRHKEQGYFLPLIREQRKWANRLSYVDLPLFPGYIFCRSHNFGLLPILSTPGVIDVVRAGTTPVPVRDEEIEALRRAIASSMPMEACAYISSGEEVTIAEGPLTGLTGIVMEVRNSKRLVLSVPLLRRSVLVELESKSIANKNSVQVLSEFDQSTLRSGLA